MYLIASEFPYGKGETFLENEIEFLANAYDEVIIIPLIKPREEHRSIPENAFIRQLPDHSTPWLEVIKKIAAEPEIIKEFIHNISSNILKNKILLKSIRNGLSISKHLKNLQENRESHKSVFYSYWLDDGAIGIALLKSDQLKVSRAHGWDIYSERHLYNYLPLRKFLADKLDIIFSISENGKSYLIPETKRPKKIKVSRLGVTNDRLFNDSSENLELNAISVSNIIPLKRVDLIGQSIRLINNKISWNHFGDGVLFDEIKDNFPFAVFHGRVSNKKLKLYLEKYAANSILINTSISEGLPVSMMEAMSFGIPCIGTNVGGVSEIIEDGENGFLMPPNPTAKTVSEYIQKYLTLPIEQKKKLRINAFKTWQEKFDAAKNYQSFVDELNSLRGSRFD